MFEYHNQNFNKPTIDTVNGQLKSLGDKFRKVANLKDDNLLTLNDMDGLMDHVQIPTNPNMFKNTKDYGNLVGTNGTWYNYRYGNGYVASKTSDTSFLYTNDIKTQIYQFYTLNSGAPSAAGLAYKGYIKLLKNHVYTVSFMLRYQPFSGTYYGQTDTDNGGWIQYPLGLYGIYTGVHNNGQALVYVDKINREWQQYCISFKAPADSDSTNIGWWFQSWDAGTKMYPGGSLYIANIKMEEGDLATPWCE